MIKFLKENIAFVIGLIVLVGLYFGIPDLKKTDSNQANVVQTLPNETITTTTDTTNLQTTSDTTVNKTNPAPAPVTNIGTQPRFQNDEESQSSERQDD